MEIKLGFGSVPKPQYVYVSQEGDYCWYMLSEEEKHISIYDKALTGVITKIECNKTVETKFGKRQKTDLHILAEQPYIIRSGRDSYFSKSLLLSLDILTSEQLHQPLTIAVAPGDKKVVFCTIYNPITYQAIKINWDEHKEIDLLSLEQKVSQKINQIQKPEIYQNTELRAIIMAQTDTYLKQLGWNPEQGRRYLQQKYGKRSRRELNDRELVDFTMAIFELLCTQENRFMMSNLAG
ncbi:hypothetical protein CEN50_10875 [Fischerella thermalis CCMEE 5268]|uniref:Uncharacterized protein n=1 Tax=Fischerella thermalis CCMEE 5268 TaxID=2019662 RepID=A0A2N6KGR8_9CYAN|nr:hypothetical protein [Fischerella thermalis]PLZ98549.1 hypothetical protein CEN50_10875 [Fischerella thermalis CCMEE 5268]